jgi:hypothetical protein
MKTNKKALLNEKSMEHATSTDVAISKSNGANLFEHVCDCMTEEKNIKILNSIKELSSDNKEQYLEPLTADGTNEKIVDMDNATLTDVSVETITVESAESAESTESAEIPLPTIPEFVYRDLPPFLQQAVVKADSPEDKDILLLGSFVAVSACLPKIYGLYDERKVYPNLYLFVTASASAGKGRLTLCRNLVEAIHMDLQEQAKSEYEDYKRQLTENKSKPDIQKPPLRMLIIPANSSATSFFQILNDNDGTGLIFETEGDTLSKTFENDYSDYSDGFRKAFHHEPISYSRRKDREYVEIKSPRLSAILSGTPRQVSVLIQSTENGLFSRFIFYSMNNKLVWKDVFAYDGKQTIEEHFSNLGNRFFEFYKTFQNQEEASQFCFTKAQQNDFNAYFEQVQKQYSCLFGNDIIASVRRLGLIAFRLAMILTTLRIIETGHCASHLTCSDIDFNTSLELIRVLLHHTAKVFDRLPSETEIQKKTLNNQKLMFLENLPSDFTRTDYITIAENLNIKARTAEGYITEFKKNGLIIHQSQGNYKVQN